jgi:hypothetical protein
MKKEKLNPGYNILLTLTKIFVLLAVLTLLPIGHHKVCILGYKAHCSFTPFSTGILLLMSMVTCIVRSRRFVKRS